MATVKYADINSLTRFKEKLEAEIPDVSGKQDTLTAGNNITITNNTISAKDNEVYIGTAQPTDPNAKIWVNPNEIVYTNITTITDGDEVSY